MRAPKCFDNMRQYLLWRAAAIRSRTSKMLPPHEYCHDCTLEYQQRMIGEKRCGNPNFRFDDAPPVR